MSVFLPVFSQVSLPRIPLIISLPLHPLLPITMPNPTKTPVLPHVLVSDWTRKHTVQTIPRSDNSHDKYWPLHHGGEVLVVQWAVANPPRQRGTWCAWQIHLERADDHTLGAEVSVAAMWQRFLQMCDLSNKHHIACCCNSSTYVKMLCEFWLVVVVLVSVCMQWMIKPKSFCLQTGSKKAHPWNKPHVGCHCESSTY